MGCDGGTIPKRDELVRTKKKKEKCAKEITNAAKWNHCHVSQQPLEKPIVADLLGYLYKKECLIEYLLDKSKYEKGPDHVKSLKDVKVLDLVPNPSYGTTKQENTDEFCSMNKSKWICSVTGLEMNGAFKFYFLFNCGCVFSERAFKTIQSANSKCIKCEKSFGENDLIVINPNEEDYELNKQKQKQRKEAIAKAKLEKASKPTPTEVTGASASALTIKDEPTTSKKESTNKKRSIDSVGGLGSLASGSKVHASDSNKKPKTIQEDPSASDVYKSLFTTSAKAKNQQKAHWVTFNPQYF